MDVPSTSQLNYEEYCDLKNLGLPDSVRRCYTSNNITKLYRWQAECLLKTGALRNGTNLVYSAPTSAGKTLIAELIILKRILESRRKAIFILPFVALAREKMLSLQKIYRRCGVRVEGFMGTFQPTLPFALWDVAVCTLEKANNLVNKIISEGNINLIGTVVVDELHSVGDESRGGLLEILLSKLLYLSTIAAQASQPLNNSNTLLNISSRFANLQIIGMSATVANLPELAQWLCAQLYISNYRPVPLTEMICIGDVLTDTNGAIVRTINDDIKTISANLNEADFLSSLVVETIIDGGGVLVFCASRAQCENVAANLTKAIGWIGRTKGSLLAAVTKAYNIPLQREFMADMEKASPLAKKNTPSRQMLICGIAYHHAGLTMEEREFIERGFRIGVVKVIVCTSTLSAGVNMPAKRVIIRAPYGGGSNRFPQLTPDVYKQMIGRAGRKGYDTTGESILMCKVGTAEVERGQLLIRSRMSPIASSLTKDVRYVRIGAPKLRKCGSESLLDDEQRLEIGNSFKKAILEAIVMSIAKTAGELETYLGGTLFAKQKQSDRDRCKLIRDIVERTIYELKNTGFVNIESNNECVTLHATQLASAAVASALGWDQTIAVYEDIAKARKAVILDNELHIIYLVTPTYMLDAWISSAEFSFARYHENWCALSDDRRRVGEKVGVSERYLIMSAHQIATKRQSLSTFSAGNRELAVHMRFYAALALSDLIAEKPIDEIAAYYGCSRGFLQTLQQQASSFCMMVVILCEHLGYQSFKQLLSGFAERLAFGINEELCDLVRLEGIDGARARALHKGGIKNIAAVLNADRSQIAAALKSATPYVQQQNRDESQIERQWLSGHPALSLDDSVELVVERAQSALREQLGDLGIDINDIDSLLREHKNVQRKKRKTKSNSKRNSIRRSNSSVKSKNSEKNRSSGKLGNKSTENIRVQTRRMQSSPRISPAIPSKPRSENQQPRSDVEASTSSSRAVVRVATPSQHQCAYPMMTPLRVKELSHVDATSPMSPDLFSASPSEAEDLNETIVDLINEPDNQVEQQLATKDQLSPIVSNDESSMLILEDSCF